MEEKKRTVTKVTSGKKAAAETAEEVKTTGKKAEGLTKAEEKSKAITLRIVSAILWVLAIGCEVLAILCLFKALRLPGLSQMWWMIIFIVIDLALCLVAGFLWKKASHLDPFKKTNNKVGFVILTQLGVIMAAICFLPLIILVLASKDKIDKKSKIVVTIVAIVALLIAGLLGADFNPISAEEKAAAEQQLGDFAKVYWTRYGHKYHLYEDCQAIKNSTDVSYSEGEEIDGEFVPAVRVAMDNGCTGLCAFCARDAEKEGINLDGVHLEDGTRVKGDEAPAEDLTLAPADGE